MRFRSTATRGLAPLFMSVLGLGTLALGVAMASAPAASAAAAHHSDTGWIRLAHLSPNTPAVDVYLYSFGNSHAMIVLHHVAYGTVSPYERVKSGEYTVAMRGAGAAPSSQPVLSASVQITPGAAFTVAGMGPAKGLRLQVIPDQLTTPPGSFHVHVAGMGGKGATNITLVAGSIHTLVVLDASGHNLQIVNLEDAAGSAVDPQGGPATGLGGTAPRPAPSPVLWAGLVAVGALIVTAGGHRMRKVRRIARHAR